MGPLHTDRLGAERATYSEQVKNAVASSARVFERFVSPAFNRHALRAL